MKVIKLRLSHSVANDRKICSQRQMSMIISLRLFCVSFLLTIHTVKTYLMHILHTEREKERNTVTYKF